MATLANLTSMPCRITPPLVGVDQPNGAAFFRVIQPQPLNLASSSQPATSGSQLWPLKA